MDTQMQFSASLTLYPENTEDFGEALELDLSQRYALPLSLNSSGDLVFYAHDFPKVVYRICKTGTTTTNCDFVLDLEDLVDMDLVFDSCDRLIKEHAECGESDQTLYTGYLTDDGQLEFNNIAIRTRLFFVTTSGSDGYSALPTQAGSIDDLSRISLSLTTNHTNGSGVSNVGQVTVIGFGTIPEKTIGDLPSLGLSEFEVSIDGAFDIDPFSIIL